MSITNYSELRAVISSTIDRDNISGETPQFIQLAESRIAKDLLGTPELWTTASMTVDAANETLPTDFVAMIRFKVDGEYPTLDYVPADQFFTTYAANVSGRPIAYTLAGGEIYFAPTPDTSYACTYTYQQKTDLATDATHRMLTLYPDLFLFASLIEAADYLKDSEEEAKYTVKYREALRGVKRAGNRVGSLRTKFSGIV